MPNAAPTHETAAEALIAAGRRFHARGWVLGTSGNFSVVTAREPLRLAITASSVDKGALEAAQILVGLVHALCPTRTHLETPAPAPVRPPSSHRTPRRLVAAADG